MTDKQMTGGCYCGAVRYRITGPVSVKAQCHCRPCQYVSGGGPNYFLIVAADDFAYDEGTPGAFARTDLDTPVTREFCQTCGTQLITRLPDGARVVIKVGTLDDPAGDYGGPKLAIYTRDMQPFHVIAEGIPAFTELPEAK